MPSFSCSAILFDLDGVLCDSTRQVDREWREWAARKGVNGDAVMAIAHGVRTVEVIRRVAPHLDAEAEAAAIENHEAHDQTGVVVMPGAAGLVKAIPDGRWAVVTSGSRLLAANRLRHCGLPVPEVMVTSDDVVNGKPHPEPYLKGAALLGFSPEECLVIEDAPAGIQSAKAGGMTVIGLASTYQIEKLREADAVTQALSQVEIGTSATHDLVVKVREVFPPGFPEQLASYALVDRGEVAWRPSAAIMAVEWFSAHGYAVLGTEAWRPEGTAIQSLPYWQSVDRKDSEEWSSFAARAAAETIGHLEALLPKLVKDDGVYINVTWVAESEFQNLKQT